MEGDKGQMKVVRGRVMSWGQSGMIQWPPEVSLRLEGKRRGETPVWQKTGRAREALKGREERRHARGSDMTRARRPPPGAAFSSLLLPAAPLAFRFTVCVCVYAIVCLCVCVCLCVYACVWVRGVFARVCVATGMRAAVVCGLGQVRITLAEYLAASFYIALPYCVISCPCAL